MDWTSPEEILRVAVLTVSFFCLFELIRFLISYWRVIYPIRLEIGNTVIAPPATITLVYHLLVGGLIASNMFSIIFSLANNRPLDPALIPVFLITVTLTYVVNVFNKVYIRILREQGSDASRH